MPKLDHLALNVSDVARVRDWYTSVLGMVVEFESQAPSVVGLTDEADFTVILTERQPPTDCCLYFQVGDIAETHGELASRGVEFLYPPQDNDWGYGAGLVDPDGRLIGLWDEMSMKASKDHEA